MLKKLIVIENYIIYLEVLKISYKGIELLKF